LRFFSKSESVFTVFAFVFRISKSRDFNNHTTPNRRAEHHTKVHRRFFYALQLGFLRNEETIGSFYALQTGFLLSEQGKRVILVNFAFCTLT